MSLKNINNIIDEHFDLRESIKPLSSEIDVFANKATSVLKDNGTIFWCGNGGSASDSQHLSAELIGRFEKDRPPLKSISLNTDTSVITALSNDYSYDTVYQRQLEVLGDAKDLLVVISTSGNSKNIINVLKEAKKKKIFSIALLGRDGGEAKKISNLSIIVPSHSTARIQEMHILIGHIVCSVKKVFFELNYEFIFNIEIGIITTVICL